MNWLRRLLHRSSRHVVSNDRAQEHVMLERRKLQQARLDWKKVNTAHDRLAEWIDESLRGGQTW